MPRRPRNNVASSFSIYFCFGWKLLTSHSTKTVFKQDSKPRRGTEGTWLEILLAQWWWIHDTCVKGDMAWCFGWHVSIHQHLSIAILESMSLSCMISGGCTRMGCLLHNLWKSLSLQSLRKSRKNEPGFHMVFRGYRSHGRAFSKSASRTKALCNSELPQFVCIFLKKTNV